MKVHPLILLIFILLTNHSLKAQCDCYTINKIWIPENSKGVINVNFINSCSKTAYLNFWLIQEKDTIARFDRCNCGVIPINQVGKTYELETVLTVLPPLNTLRLSIGPGNFCPSIKFSPELFVLATEEEAINELKIYPNPTDDSINLENIPFNTAVQLFNLQGVFLQEWILREKQKISLKSYPLGTYLLKYQIGNQAVIKKIVKSE
jgi:Secretion system C-terminal sorting domain